MEKIGYKTPSRIGIVDDLILFKKILKGGIAYFVYES